MKFIFYAVLVSLCVGWVWSVCLRGREVTPQISWLPPLLRALPSMAWLAWHATAPPFIFSPRVIKTILSWRWGSAEQKLLTFLPNPKTRLA